jgi:sec-independent protein translocase protein TatA
MFGSIGGSEFLLIAVLALLLFGPRKLPQIGRSIGRALAEFRGATQEFKSSLEREVELDELRDAKNGVTAVGREIADTAQEASRPTVARGPIDSAGAGGPGPADEVTPQANPPGGPERDDTDAPPADSPHGETPTQS